MKLALFVPGGVDRSGTHRVIHCILWLIERLARAHEVHVFALNQEPNPGDWKLLGAHVHNVGSVRGWRRRLYAAFSVEHRAMPFDVIHGIFGWGGLYGGLLGRWHRVPVLFHPDGGEFVAVRDIGYGYLCTLRGVCEMRLALAVSSRLSVSSRYHQRIVAAFAGDVLVVPMGVALDRWHPSAPRARDVSRPARLLHIGDWRPVKDQPTILAAVRSLIAAGHDVELDVVGHDTLDGALQRSPDAQALQSRVRWHRTMHRVALRDLVDRADLLVMASRHEAGPLVILEAAIAGVPAVGTAVGHFADWTPDAALAVPVGDAGALAAAIAELLADEPRRLAIAHEAQRRALAIDADCTAASFEQLYRELCAE